MKMANISYTKNHLSSLLARVKEGETIVIMDRNRPVARLEPAGDVQAAGAPAWVGEGVRRGVLLPRKAPLNIHRLQRLPIGKARRGGGILKALAEDREDRV